MCPNIQNVFVILSDPSQMNNGFYLCTKKNSRNARFVIQLCQLATASIAPDKRSTQINIYLFLHKNIYFDIVCTEKKHRSGMHLKIALNIRCF